MALPKNRPFNIIRVHAHLADSSTAGSAFTSMPCRGKIVKVGSVIYNAITVADSVVTTKLAGTTMTNGSITITQSGSAAGQVNTATPTANHRGVEDDKIEFASDGGATTTCPTMFWADIKVE